MPAHYLLKASSIPLTTTKVARLSEEEAWAHFAKMRWGDSGEQECPRCKAVAAHYFKKTRKQWQCRQCKHTFSVTSGTLLSNRKLPFGDLLTGMFTFTASPKGEAALAMRKHIGHSYRTNFLLAGKFRESIVATRDETPLSGLIHVDGAHFSGYIRKGRVIKVRGKKKEMLEIPKKYAVDNPTGSDADQESKMGRQHRSKYPKRAGQFMPNRRIVMVFREVSRVKGEGGIRTLTAIIHRETSAEILALTKKWVKKGSTVWSDECPSYGNLKLYGYDHDAVNHKYEFSNDKGVNENQAESYFSRLRRAEVGVYHRITPKYMDDYAAEMAWREDVRRKNTAEQLYDLGSRVMRTGPSKDWRNYSLGQGRKDEKLFWIGKDPRLSKPKNPYSRPTQTQ